MGYFWRPMTEADLPQVMDIAAQVHIGYFESEAVFAGRLALFAPGCQVAQHPAGNDSLGGYLVAHPSRLGYPPPLNTLLDDIGDGATCLHLHDIALLPATRGGGLGAAAIGLLHQLMQAHALPHASLVAVHDSCRYWQRFGFLECGLAPGARLDGYGDAARYMSASEQTISNFKRGKN